MLDRDVVEREHGYVTAVHPSPCRAAFEAPSRPAHGSLATTPPLYTVARARGLRGVAPLHAVRLLHRRPRTAGRLARTHAAAQARPLRPGGHGQSLRPRCADQA